MSDSEDELKWLDEPFSDPVSVYLLEKISPAAEPRLHDMLTHYAGRYERDNVIRIMSDPLSLRRFEKICRRTGFWGIRIISHHDTMHLSKQQLIETRDS